MPKHGTAYRYDPSTLSPRLKGAIRLYGSGAVKSMREASEAFGLDANALSFRKHQDPRVDIFLAQIDREIDQGTVDMSKVIQRLGRKAVVNIARLAEGAQKEDVRLRANQDLADRSAETMKTHKVQLEQDIKLESKDIEQLRAALLESSKARDQFAAVIEGDYVTVDEESSVRHLKQLPAPSAEGNGTGHTVPR